MNPELSVFVFRIEGGQLPPVTAVIASTEDQARSLGSLPSGYKLVAKSPVTEGVQLAVYRESFAAFSQPARDGRVPIVTQVHFAR